MLPPASRSYKERPDVGPRGKEKKTTKCRDVPENRSIPQSRPAEVAPACSLRCYQSDSLVEHLLVRSAGVEPAATWPSTKPVFLFAARAHGAATRCRPGSPAVRKRGRSRARRRSWPSWPRTRKLRGQGPAGLPNSPNGHRCGRCDSNAHAARFELARYAKIPVTPAWCAARDSNPDRDTG